MDWRDFVEKDMGRRKKALVAGGWLAPPEWIYDLAYDEKLEREEEPEFEEIEIRAGDGSCTKTFRYYRDPSATHWAKPSTNTYDRDQAQVFPGVGTMRKFFNETRGSFMIPCGGKGNGCQEISGFMLQTTVYHNGDPAFFCLTHGENVRVWNTDSPSIEQLVIAVKQICDDSSGKCVPFWQG